MKPGVRNANCLYGLFLCSSPLTKHFGGWTIRPESFLLCWPTPSYTWVARAGGRVACPINGRGQDRRTSGPDCATRLPLLLLVPVVFINSKVLASHFCLSIPSVGAMKILFECWRMEYRSTICHNIWRTEIFCMNVNLLFEAYFILYRILFYLWRWRLTVACELFLLPPLRKKGSEEKWSQDKNFTWSQKRICATGDKRMRPRDYEPWCREGSNIKDLEKGSTHFILIWSN